MDSESPLNKRTGHPHVHVRDFLSGLGSQIPLRYGIITQKESVRYSRAGACLCGRLVWSVRSDKNPFFWVGCSLLSPSGTKQMTKRLLPSVLVYQHGLSHVAAMPRTAPLFQRFLDALEFDPEDGPNGTSQHLENLQE